MQGKYKGFSTLLSEEAPNQVHIWCYAHVLNLVLTDTTGVVVPSTSLFLLLNDVAVFIRESYKRMLLWETVSEDRRHRRLAPIGATRWLAKDEALRKVFGSFGKPGSGLYIDLVITLTKIQEDESMPALAKAKARGYVEALLRHETILTAEIFLRIFEETTPLSKYLQSTGMDLLTAQGFVAKTEDRLITFSRDFDGVQRAAKVFVDWANDSLEVMSDEFEVESELPEKRVKKKKAMPGELARDEPLPGAETDFRIKVHNVILDTIKESIHRRFAASAVLCSDIACMDPKNFKLIRDKGLPEKALEELSKCLLKFNEDATGDRLQSELINLANRWETLKMPPLRSYTVRQETERATDLDEEGGYTEPEDELEELEIQSSCSSCKNCPICCYAILSKYNLLSDSYHIIGLGYKYLLTLSVTQVARERTFSTLKFVKDRLRSSMSQDRLQAFLLMSIEKETLMELDIDGIINKFAETSDLMRRQLTF